MSEKPNHPTDAATNPHKGMDERPWKQYGPTPVRRPGAER